MLLLEHIQSHNWGGYYIYT